MSRRIDIELTSARPDGTWTWRAAGARQPKGVLDGAVLYEGAKAGDVVRADAEFEIEGITILTVIPPKEKRVEPQRLEILGSGRPEAPPVTTQLVGRRGRDMAGPGSRQPDEGRRDRRGPGDRRSGPRQDREGDGGQRRRRDSAERADGRAHRDGGGRAAASGPASGPRPSRHDADPAATEERRPSRKAEGNRASKADRGNAAGRPTAPEPRAKSRRLSPGHAHRGAVLEDLSPEERAVAEQVLRGGVPAVRTALHLEREKAAAEGRPAPDTDALVTLAERLLPRLRAAEWHDRADAAVKAGDDISLRDLRTVVAGADAARHDDTRALASELREALERRQAQLRATWMDEVRAHLDGQRVVRAIRLAGRPPEPATRLPAEVTEALSAAASAALSPDTAPERWLALLEAVADSPVRRDVKPLGLPAEPGPELDRVARQLSGRVPALAGLLGITIPPPPGPRRPVPPPPPPPARPADGSEVASAEG